MDAYMDFFNRDVMGSVQVLTGFYFFTRFLQRKVKFYVYLLFALCWIIMMRLIPTGRIAEFLLYVLLLTASGIVVCHADWKSVVLYAALTVEIMQLSYGIVNSLWGMLYPQMVSFEQKILGIAFMLLGNMAALLLAVLCYHMAQRCFLYYETVKKQYIFTILTPILMIFLMEEYISSIIYGNITVIDNSRMIAHTNHYQMFAIQLLGMASLFCIMFAYKKLLQNFCLGIELSLLEQEEHSLNQYVEEAKAHYEKTRSFRHDIKNHITVVRKLLQKGKSEQALNYIGDMEELTEELSFPCSTNNPVADILVGNKLGIAQSMGIDVYCSLLLPYPCFVRDIDFCIILSNALDNAIHACKSMGDGADKYIRVTGRIQGDFVLLEIENSFQGQGLFRKGTGLSNVEMVAEKYHGAMSIKAEGTAFILSVLLIIPQHSESIPQQIG
ncbi:MAG: GHKL domain-containing protein [Lachnospiraceae bacterium]|nr:GHKL domain-containing protein [Lachnospiraceae bacterium]